MRYDVKKALDTLKISAFGNNKDVENAEMQLYRNESVSFFSPATCVIISENISSRSLSGIAILTDKRFIFHYKVSSNELTEAVSVNEINSINCSGNGKKSSCLEIHTSTKTYSIILYYKQKMMQYIQNLFEWTVNNAKSNTSVTSSQEYLQPTQSALNSTFSTTNCVGQFLEIDEKNKLWRLPLSYRKTVFSYADILEYEVIKNGISVTKGGLGRAVTGGALFGVAGAVVGGVTGKRKTTTKVTEHKIKITLKNPHLPVAYIGIPLGSDYIADKIAAYLAQMIKEAETTASSNATQPAIASAADEIIKFKQLLDAGAITQEEFEAKKNQLLSL